MQQRLTDGAPILSANSVPMFLMESFAQQSSDIARGVLHNFETLYPTRAQTNEDLYKHMSDYDYVGLFSSPSSVYIQLILRKDQLIKFGVDFNSQYKKIIIPKNSVFMLDQYQFSLYYPIEIKINTHGNVQVGYDVTERNPLHTVAQATLEHREGNVKGLDMISIQIPLYQFKTDTILETITTNAGFSKSYAYSNKFYAARVFTDNGPNGEWVELQQTLSDDMYDPKALVAKLSVNQDESAVRITLPQVNMTEKRLGGRLRIELMTTQGAVDADITNLSPEQISAKFTLTGDADVDKYSNVLVKPDTIIVVPSSNKIIGGGDGMSFEELRQNVIFNTFQDGVLLTPNNLTNYFKNIGFRITKYQDGITNRIYLAHKDLTDNNGVIVASANLATTFDRDLLNSLSTVTNNSDGSFTLLPTTVYKYDGTFAKPLLDSELTTLTSLSRKNLVAELNDNVYTLNPFHIRIETNDKYPVANTYDFTAPVVKHVEFLKENINVVSQLSVFNANISHPESGVGGFTLELGVIKSADLVDVDIADIKIMALFNTSAETPIYQEAVYVGESDNMSVFHVVFETDYVIDTNHRLELTSLQSGSQSGFYIDLETEIRFVFMVNKAAINYPPRTQTDVGLDISQDYPTYAPLAEQKLTVFFGEWVKESFTKVDVWASDEIYERYLSTEYLTYPAAQYARANGDLEYTTDPITSDVALIPTALTGDYMTTTKTVLLTGVNGFEYIGAFIVGSRVVLSPANQGDYIDNGVTKLVHDVNGYEERVDVPLTSLNIADYLGYQLYWTGDEITDANVASYYNTVLDIIMPIIAHREGDVVIQAGGVSVTEPRKILYNVDLTHVDKKLQHSEDPNSVGYFGNIAGQLRSYFSAVKTALPNLIEETELYFRPMRTLGSSTFKISDKTTSVLDLELSMTFKLYVPPYVLDDEKLKITIKNAIVTVIDRAINGNTLSITDIASRIKEQLPTLVSHVDVLGINGRSDLQTLLPLDETVVPSLGQRLFIADDGSIGIERKLDIQYVSINPR